MAITKKETSYTLSLDIPSEIRGTDRDELLADISEFLVTEMIIQIEAGHSPVKGVGDFKPLSTKYANDQKGGNRLANLDLNGDMLNALTSEIVGRNKIKVGIFDESQAIKSYGHNTGFKGHKILEKKGVKRQFIPNPDQKLAKDITKTIEEMIAEKLAEVKDNG